MAENQEHIEAQLCAYIDGELDAKGRAEIEKHLANNPQHQRLIAGLIESRAMMRSLPRENAPEDILESVQHSLERSVLLADADDDAIAMPRRRTHGSHMMLAAAIVLLTIGLGVVIYFVLPSSTHPGDVAMVPPPARRAEVPAADSATREIITKTAPMPEIAMKGGASESKTASHDPFIARGGAENKAAQSQFVDALSNSNNLNSQKLSDADGRLVLVVNTDNPAITNGQVTSYLVNNGIAWQKVNEPMPQPLEIGQSQVVEMSRLNQTHVQLRAGDRDDILKQSLTLDHPAPGSVSGGGGGGGAASQPSQTFAIAPTTSPTSPASPSALVYQFLGFGPNNEEQSKASNRIVANMTRRQAAELSATLQNSRAGQRAMVYGRELSDIQIAGEMAGRGVDKAPSNYSLKQASPSASPPTGAQSESTKSESTTKQADGYASKAPVQSASSGEIALKSLASAPQKISPGGAKDAKEELPASKEVSGKSDTDGGVQRKAEAASVDQEKLPATQTVTAVQSPTTQPSLTPSLTEDERLDVVIFVNEDAATTEPTVGAGAATQPTLEAP